MLLIFIFVVVKTHGPFNCPSDGQLNGPWGLCVQKCGDHHNLLVCNAGNGPVDQFTVEGCFTGKTVYKLQDPKGITTTPGGLILVTDCKTKKIHILKK